MELYFKLSSSNTSVQSTNVLQLTCIERGHHILILIVTEYYIYISQKLHRHQPFMWNASCILCSFWMLPLKVPSARHIQQLLWRNENANLYTECRTVSIAHSTLDLTCSTEIQDRDWVASAPALSRSIPKRADALTSNWDAQSRIGASNATQTMKRI